tara:strand:+ start:151 stop:318 length:168 start_codon:yes stop_codon:yes gene_type:complete
MKKEEWKFEDWKDWWNRNYKLSVADRMMIVDFSILQNIEGAREFNKFIADSYEEL